MNNIRIEQPETPDFSAIDKLCLAGLMEQNPPPTEKEAKDIVQSLKSSLFKILLDDTEMRGVIYFSPNNSDASVKIDFLYAAEKRKGLGTLLLDSVIELVRKNNFNSIVLEVSSIDERANGFYKAKGFTKTGERIINEQLTLSIMRLKI